MATGPTSSRLPHSPRLDRRSETLFADSLRPTVAPQLTSIQTPWHGTRSPHAFLHPDWFPASEAQR
jgi:hypothetical protein